MKLSCSIKALVLTGLVVLICAPVVDAQQNLVVNGGFESGLTGWNPGSNSSYQGITSNPADVHSGNYAYYDGPYPSYGDLSQDITTQAGATYDVSFWLKSPGGPSDAVVTFGGNQLLDLSPAGGATPNSPWVQYTFQSVATTASSILDFHLRTHPDNWYLDDVSVTTAAPEASSVVIAAIGLVGAGALVRSRRSRLQT